MKHFIATRFNLKPDTWKTAKDGSPIRTETWLEERFDLFEKYCLPSVVNQKNQNFYWLIFFDIDTPDKYRDRIEKMTSQYANFKPLYIDGTKSLRPSLKQFIIENSNQTDDFIITTRLDNDDAIHQDFVSTVQSLAVEKHETVIDLRRGYQMNLSDDIYEFRNFDNNFNPFISLVERLDKCNTVVSKFHTDWSKSNSIIIYEKSPLWIEIIHKKNIANQTKFNLPLIKQIPLNEFGIKKELESRSHIYILKNNFNLQKAKLWKNAKQKAKTLLQRTK